MVLEVAYRNESLRVLEREVRVRWLLFVYNTCMIYRSHLLVMPASMY